MTDDHPDGPGKKTLKECADSRTDRFPVSKAGSRRRREVTGQAPIRLRHWGWGVGDGSHGGVDLSSIVLELPLSELARIMPQRFAGRLYGLVRRYFAVPQGLCFPCSLANLLNSRSLQAALRSNLAHVDHLSELIVDPPAILIDARQKLFFYRGIPVPLRPVSFRYMLLLAQSPGEVVPREEIYRYLWPGELDYEGTNKPYEGQVSDHKRKLVAEIKKGIDGRLDIREGEVESLIATRSKTGYMLNCARENILILRGGEYTVSPFLILLTLDRFITSWSGWLPALPGVLCQCR